MFSRFFQRRESKSTSLSLVDYLKAYYLARDPDVDFVIEIAREISPSVGMHLVLSRLVALKTWAYCYQWCFRHPQTGADELNRAVQAALDAVPYEGETPASYLLTQFRAGRQRFGWDQVDELLQQPLRDPSSVFDDFGKWLSNPTPEGFLSLREAVLASGVYRPYPVDPPLARLRRALEEGQYQQVLDTLYNVEGPNYLLCPTAQTLIAEAHQLSGDFRAAHGAAFCASRCLQALLATGDGSVPRPYQVLHVEDEYEVIRALGLSPVSQSLQLEGDRFLDVITTREGRAVVFDVTVLQAAERATIKRKIP